MTKARVCMFCVRKTAAANRVCRVCRADKLPAKLGLTPGQVRRLKDPPARARVPLEAEVQRSILLFLRLSGVMVERVNVGMIPNGRGGFRSSGQKGMSDLIGILRGGRFLAIEVKRPGGKATAAQHAFLERVNRAGGLGFIATSSAEVHEMLAGLL